MNFDNISFDGLKNTVNILREPTVISKRKALVGSKEQIEAWKQMFGDSVDYYENGVVR